MAYTAPYPTGGTYSVPGSVAPAAQPQGQTSAAQGAYAPVQIGQTGNTSVAQVAAPPAPQAYMDALQASFGPQFQQSQQQLNAQQQAMGTLTSGAGNYANQQLTAQNNATLAGAEAPLIQQGFAQAYGANTTNAGAQNAENMATQGINANANTQNAGATNSYLTDLQNQYFQGGQNSANNALQGQEFNSGLLANIYNNNQNATNQLQLAQMGYGNQDYMQQVSQMAGLEAQGLGGQLGTTANGQNAQDAAYLQTQQMVNPYMQSIGAASAIPGYSNYGSSNGIGSDYPTMSYPSTSGTDPYSGNWNPASAYGSSSYLGANVTGGDSAPLG